MTSTLSCGHDLGDHVFDADFGGDLLGDGAVVTGEQDRGQAQGPQLRDGLVAGRLDLVGHDEHAAGLAVPADGDGGLAVRLGVRLGAGEVDVEVLRPVGQQRLASDQDGVALHDALDALALDVGEVLRRRQRADLLGCALGDRLGDRVLGGVLEGAGQAQQLARGRRRRRRSRRRGSSCRW